MNSTGSCWPRMASNIRCVLAFTLMHGPQHYEPRFYSHKIPGNSVPVIDEWCVGYVKSIALDAAGWQPLVDARPDWFEVIQLYGTKDGWERLKELVEAHKDRFARHQALVDRIALPLATSMGIGLPGAPRSSTRRLILAATIHAHVAPARSSSVATGRRTSFCIRQPKFAPLPAVPASGQRTRFFSLNSPVASAGFGGVRGEGRCNDMGRAGHRANPAMPSTSSLSAVALGPGQTPAERDRVQHYTITPRHPSSGDTPPGIESSQGYLGASGPRVGEMWRSREAPLRGQQNDEAEAESEPEARGCKVIGEHRASFVG